MNIETVTDWYLNGPRWQVFLVVLAFTWAAVTLCRVLYRAMRRRWERRRKSPQVHTQPERSQFANSECGIGEGVRLGEVYMFNDVSPEQRKVAIAAMMEKYGIPKPAPDRQYQGDQVTGIRKEVQELQGDFGRLHMSVQHLQADTQDLVDIRSRLFALEGKAKQPTEWVTGGGSVMFAHPPCTHLASEYRVWERHNFLHLQADAGRLWVRDKRACMSDPLWTRSEWSPRRSGDPFTELHGPEKDAIVASFEAWRAGQ